MTLLYLALGVVAGIRAGLFGIGGGGVIMVIGMATVLKLSLTTAIESALGSP